MSRYSLARPCQQSDRKLQGGDTCLLPAEAKRELALSTQQGFVAQSGAPLSAGEEP